jgi:hypothetical protein
LAGSCTSRSAERGSVRPRSTSYRSASTDPLPQDDPDNHRLKASNLAALWKNYHAAGARCLVIGGPIDTSDALTLYTSALPDVAVTLCRMHANPDQLGERIARRGQGLGPPIPGDDLAGHPRDVLRQVTDKAIRNAQQLTRDGLGDLAVGTGHRSPEEAADEILRRTN